MIDPQIEQDLRAGRKVAAIKRYRLATGASLKDAMAVVNAHEAQLRVAGRLPPARGYAAAATTGTLIALTALAVALLLPHH